MNEHNPVILVVDDEGSSLRLLTALLQAESYNVLTASNASEAMAKVQDFLPDLVLTDGMMPGISGFELAAKIKSDDRYATIPVVIVTALDDREIRLQALKAGVDEFLCKPIDRAELKVRISNLLRLKEYGDRIRRNNEILDNTVRERTSQLHDSYLQTIQTLIRAAQKKDEETGAHLQRIAYYCKELAEQVGMDSDFTNLIFRASPMHDVGKIGIPDRILLKSGPLDEAEWSVMRTHSTIGANIIGEKNVSEELRMGWEIALGHHERWDGSGYPLGRKGEETPFCARMMVMADIYDALRSRRSYKEPLDHHSSVEIILKGDGRVRPEHFDPQLLAIFPKVAEAFCEYYTVLTDLPPPDDEARTYAPD
jgi:putative two-component system response regulator